MEAAKIAVVAPTKATKLSAYWEYSNKGEHLATKKTPAVTIVAAWINAETGVGPSMASGSHVWRIICADFPIAPIKKKKQPIFVGGTGLYFKLLTEGISNIPKIPDSIRIKARKLNTNLGNDKFYSLLIKLDPLVQNKIKKNDTHRLIRAYEVVTFTKKSLIDWQKKNKNYFSNYQFVKIFINPENNSLQKLLRLRLKKMFELGAVDEVKKFLKLKINPSLPANKILGIEEIKKYLNKKASLEQAFEETFVRTRRYVKRQRTWSRGHMKDWISIFNPNFDILTKKIINLVTSSWPIN